MNHTPEMLGIVLTLNEADHLPDCLRSLTPLVARVLVLDSGSADATVAIAREAGACVATRAFDGYANQRNAALALPLASDADWVLFLDADERVTPAGAAELRAAVAHAPADVSAFQLPRRNVMFGQALRGGGWWPDVQTRLLRVGHARYDASRHVHELVLVDGGDCMLTEPLIHLNYARRREFLSKQANYTRLRAQQATRRGFRPRRRAYLSAPARELWRRFVTLHGYRDRLTGLFLALAVAAEEVRACWLIRRGTRA
jgi:glycosyltransferase involved in cell wall biosynthesis